MALQIVSKNGGVYDISMVKAVDNLLAKIRNKPMWDGIEMIVDVFLLRYPQYKRKQVTSQNKYGENDKIGMRHLLEMPYNLKRTIEFFYSEDINSYKGGSRGFWIDFAQRYPNFSVGQKI